MVLSRVSSAVSFATSSRRRAGSIGGPAEKLDEHEMDDFKKKPPVALQNHPRTTTTTSSNSAAGIHSSSTDSLPLHHNHPADTTTSSHDRGVNSGVGNGGENGGEPSLVTGGGDGTRDEADVADGSGPGQVIEGNEDGNGGTEVTGGNVGNENEGDEDTVGGDGRVGPGRRCVLWLGVRRAAVRQWLSNRTLGEGIAAAILSVSMVTMVCVLIQTSRNSVSSKPVEFRNLNKEATSIAELGLPMWRVVISSGILSAVFGFFALFVNYWYRNKAAGLTVREVRSHYVPHQELPPSAYLRPLSLTGTQYNPDEPMTRREKFISRLPFTNKRESQRFPVISGPYNAHKEDNYDVEKNLSRSNTMVSHDSLPRDYQREVVEDVNELQRPPTALHPYHRPQNSNASNRYSASQYSVATNAPF